MFTRVPGGLVVLCAGGEAALQGAGIWLLVGGLWGMFPSADGFALQVASLDALCWR